MLSYTQPKHYLSECVFRPSTALLVTYFFFFIDTASTEIYTLSLHDALPISLPAGHEYLHLHPSKKAGPGAAAIPRAEAGRGGALRDYPWRIAVRGGEERAAGGSAGALTRVGASALGDGPAGDGGGSLWNDAGGAGAQGADDREYRSVDCRACEGSRVDTGYE